ncbi:MAG: DNA-3-methyladenine glycosylase [Streptosporangiaceae bacterium]
MTSEVHGGDGWPGPAGVGPSAPSGSLTLNGARWDMLDREFLDRPVLQAAPELLGCLLAHETDDGLVAAEIVEVEAYRGESDPASHAFRGKTARNAVMFGEAGHAYVYFTYGMHFCVNLVCQAPGHAAAVLLRAGRVVAGAELAAKRRGARAVAERDLARGPARLCQALGIERPQNGADVCDPASPLRVLARPGFEGLPSGTISSGPRVGVRLGAEDPWRFWVTGEPAVSVFRPYVPKRRTPQA